MWDLVFGWIDSFADRAVVFAGLFTGLLVHLRWRRTDTPKNDTDRNSIIASLREDRFGARYRAVLKRALDAVDTVISHEEAAGGVALNDKAIAWSYRLLCLSLGIALAYPVLSLQVNWGLLSNGARSWDAVISEGNRLFLAAAMCGAALIISIGLASKLFQGQARSVFRLVSVGLVCAVTGFFAATGMDTDIGTPASAFIYGGSFGGILALVFAALGGFLSAVILASAGSWAISINAADPSQFVYIFMVIGSAFCYFLDRICIRQRRRSISLSIWVLFAIFILSIAVQYGANSLQFNGFILFVGALPLINGLADFASTGLTRYLLRRSLATSGRWEAALDLIGGVAIYLALGCAIIVFIACTPLPDHTYLANLPRIFADLADPALRGGYWWLLAMLASTLLPTLLHLHVFLATLIRHVPARLRHWLADEFEQAANIDSNVRGRDLVLLLAALNAFAAIASLWLMFELWLTVSPLAIDGSVAFFRAFALAIGAIA
jgi:hypothetical protein